MIFSFRKMWALVQRHGLLLWRDTNMKLSHFYWPLRDVMVWGFLGSWIQQSQPGQFYNYQVLALLGVLLWQTSCRCAIVLSLTFVEELWAHNLVNLFTLPISLLEWMCGVTLYTMIISTIVGVYYVALIYLFQDHSFWSLFTTYFTFAPPLFIAGLWLAFFCLLFISYFGKRAQELVYVIPWFFAPFSTAFYPLETLPLWAQRISYFLPMSYIFEGMRAHLVRQQPYGIYLAKGYALAILYTLIAIMAFVFVFNKSKQKGLARLSD